MKSTILALGLVILLLFSQKIYAQEITSISISELMAEMNKQDDTTRICNLWATWCAPCIKELPYFEEANEEFKAENRKVKIILLAVADLKIGVQKFVERKKLKSQVLFLDEEDMNAWIPKIDKDWQGEIPVTLAINNAKKNRAFHIGSMTKEQLLELVNKASN